MDEDDLRIEKTSFNGGKLNMNLSGEPAKVFFSTLVQLFEDNNCKNFVTVAVEHDSDKYEITIRNCNGTKTPAEKLIELEKELEELKSNIRNWE